MITRRDTTFGLASSLLLSASTRPALAAPTESVIPLPEPRHDGGMPLYQALAQRHSTRAYEPRAVSIETLSQLLWAANGINRPASGDRTAPYWRHIMVIDIYVATADGVFLYDPKQHALLPHLSTDIRAQTGLQDFVATAPVNIIYVAHGERMLDVSAEERRLYASVDAGFIGQNVYLACAAEGLGSVFRAAVDTGKLGIALELPPDRFVTFAQTIGYAKAS